MLRGIALAFALASCATPTKEEVRPEPSEVVAPDATKRVRDAEAAPPAPTASPPASEVEERAFSLRSGFITGTLKIPALPSGPKPAILHPLVDEAELLRRGAVVVRYDVHWDLLADLQPHGSDDAASTAIDPAGAEGNGAGAEDSTARAEGRAAGAEAESRAATATPADPTPAGRDAEPVGKWLLAADRPERVGQRYFDLVAANAGSVVPAVVEHLASIAAIDAARIAIAGSSTGGFVALEALLGDAPLAAAVVRVACGDYHTFLASSSLALAGEERWLEGGAVVLAPEYEADLREREPIRHAHRLPPRPLLMLNGGQDPAIPVACAEATARAFERAYDRAGVRERFRFVLYPDDGHDLSSEAATSEILGWWERWLGLETGS